MVVDYCSKGLMHMTRFEAGVCYWEYYTVFFTLAIIYGIYVTYRE